MTTRFAYFLAVSFVLAACGAPDADKGVPITTASRPPPATIAPAPIPAPASPGLVEAAALPAATATSGTTGPLYYCVNGSGTATQRTPIAFAPAVEALCRKAPEMGPCQYERDACRRDGGRVFTAGGTEITREVESEYDKKVMRIRMKSN